MIEEDSKMKLRIQCLERQPHKKMKDEVRQKEEN